MTSKGNDFTPGEQALIEKMIYRVWDGLEPKLLAAVDQRIDMHVQTCPVGKAMRNLRILLVGIVLGVALATGGVGYAIGVASKVAPVMLP